MSDSNGMSRARILEGLSKLAHIYGDDDVPDAVEQNEDPGGSCSLRPPPPQRTRVVLPEDDNDEHAEHQRPTIAPSDTNVSPSNCLEIDWRVDNNARFFGETPRQDPIADDSGRDENNDGGGYGIAGDNQCQQLVPVEHPEEMLVEDELGSETEADRYCYICENVPLHDPLALSTEVRTILQLLADARKKYNNNFLMVARKVKADYDESVLEPYFKLAENARLSRKDHIRPWTLRGIYNHLRKHDTSPDATIDNVIHNVCLLANTLFKGGVFVAPRSKIVRGRLISQEGLTVNHNAYLMYMGSLKQLAIYEKLRNDIGESGKASKGTGNDGPGGKGKKIGAVASIAEVNTNVGQSGGDGAMPSRYRPTVMPDL